MTIESKGNQIKFIKRKRNLKFQLRFYKSKRVLLFRIIVNSATNRYLIKILM
jgi:hypothetical protein